MYKKDKKDCFNRWTWAKKLPCTSFAVFIFNIACSISSMVSLFLLGRYLRILLKDENLLPLLLFMCIGVFIGMFIISVIFLCLSLPPSNIQTNQKTLCFTILHFIMVIFVLMIQLVWILLCILIAILIAALYQIVSIQKSRNSRACLRLSNYGIMFQHMPICGNDFKEFAQNIQNSEIIICALVTFVSSLLVVICQTCFIMLITAAHVRIKENKKLLFSPILHDFFSVPANNNNINNNNNNNKNNNNDIKQSNYYNNKSKDHSRDETYNNSHALTRVTPMSILKNTNSLKMQHSESLLRKNGDFYTDDQIIIESNSGSLNKKKSEKNLNKVKKYSSRDSPSLNKNI